MPRMAWFGWILAAYLIGALPFGFLIGKLQGVDLRTVGSGNVGATNVGRVLGRKWGAACFALDLLKGAAPVLAYGRAMAGDGALELLVWLAVAAAAVLGHVFPIYLRFKGGKGVATGLGVLLGFWPVLTLPGLAAAGLWLATLGATRYVSLASVLAAASLPLLTAISAWAWGRPAPELALYVAVTLLLALLVVLRHRDNIARLRAGTEPQVGRQARQSPG